jgi:hypothetical protein
VLVIRGRGDVLRSADCGRRLAGQAADGDYVELADAYTFPWDIRPRGRSRSGRSPAGCRDDEFPRTPLHGDPGRRCNLHTAVDWRV